MVKLLAVIFFNCVGDRDPAIITSSFNLSSFGFFQSGSVKEFCTFASRECCKRSDSNTTNLIEHKGYILHVKKYLSGLCVTCVCDSEFPTPAARGFLQKSVELFHGKFPHEKTYSEIVKDTNLELVGLEKLLIECDANPQKADVIYDIHTDLDQTKEIMKKNIEQLFTRGESLDDLVQKSEDISFQSKIMLERAEAMNDRCCVLFLRI